MINLFIFNNFLEITFYLSCDGSIILHRHYKQIIGKDTIHN